MVTMRRLLAFLLAALALTACKIDATVAVVVQPDGSGSIVLTVVADADVVAQAPGLAEDLRFDDAVAAGWVLDGPAATEAGGLSVTLTHSFATVEEATVLLQSVNGTGGPLHDVALARTVAGDAVTTSLTGNVRVEGGMDAFADPEVLAAIGGSPYADDIAATGQRPADVVTFTVTADLPGDVPAGAAPSSGTATAADGPLTWTVPLDGTTADLATTTVYTGSTDDGGSGIWGTVATVALVALIAWCVLAAAFIAFVAKARRDKARRRAGVSR
jgi:hypothetical protein